MILSTLTLDVITHSYPNFYVCFAKSHGERCVANTNTRLCNLQTRSCISRKCIDHGTFKGTHVQCWIKIERAASTHISRASYVFACMYISLYIHILSRRLPLSVESRVSIFSYAVIPNTRQFQLHFHNGYNCFVGVGSFLGYEHGQTTR